MIIIYHSDKSIKKVIDSENKKELLYISDNITKLLFELSNTYKGRLLIWCDIFLENELNIKNLPKIFHHNKIFATFSASGKYSLSDNIQLVDQSFLCNPNRNVSYPTYFMSSEVGGIHSSILNAFGGRLKKHRDFDYFLCSLAKISIPLGLLCYSEPSLIINHVKNIQIKSEKSLFRDFKFIAQHWKKPWVFFFFLNLFLFDKKIAFAQLIYSVFYFRQNVNLKSLDKISFYSYKNLKYVETFDVVIPTIGRKKYLMDFLWDLCKQTKLPRTVIIVEQNPQENSISELDYLLTEEFPFEVKHIFTKQTGACNARNLALSQINSEWIFLADDDIRIGESFLERICKNIEIYKVDALTLSCLQKNEKKTSNAIVQSNFFGSGCSVINSKIIKKIKFDTKFEHGFGEDNDFGMQIRNLGYDILYFPEPEILHLKAPVGGFRTKPKLQWSKSDDLITPKPSPTVMLFNLKHNTQKQILAYRTILAISYYKVQPIKNPFKFINRFIKQWKLSLEWANILLKS
jgi:glycosyltransferase involved in cell wall biosynthesis